jgi:benzoyl-CoA reductase/2-hydroxyglutaryl-CoA dehydratase subunit BcrC/BadD/HgdB
VIHAAINGIDAESIVLATVCDPMRHAATLLETRPESPAVFLLNVPSTWQTDVARQLYFQELQRLGRFLAAMSGISPTDAALVDAMLDFERQREESRREKRSANRGIPLAVLGGPMIDSAYDLFHLIEQAGGHVALDATEGSPRTQPCKFNSERLRGNPLQALADAYFDGIVDVFRRPNHPFYQWLAKELTISNVRGILLRRYVWCDLWHAELSRIRQEAGLPVLEIDVGNDDAENVCRTQGRLEAFLETLQ